ncbi:hypothetical protein DFJ73DRAFT_892694 [Zopfochytrium polystomum]|nr:hypothetical protein DFJ73DRAFT_892694 [Zopfochytrium polystomum]
MITSSSSESLALVVLLAASIVFILLTMTMMTVTMTVNVFRYLSVSVLLATVGGTVVPSLPPSPSAHDTSTSLSPPPPCLTLATLPSVLDLAALIPITLLFVLVLTPVLASPRFLGFLTVPSFTAFFLLTRLCTTVYTLTSLPPRTLIPTRPSSPVPPSPPLHHRRPHHPASPPPPPASPFFTPSSDPSPFLRSHLPTPAVRTATLRILPTSSATAAATAEGPPAEKGELDGFLGVRGAPSLLLLGASIGAAVPVGAPAQDASGVAAIVVLPLERSWRTKQREEAATAAATIPASQGGAVAAVARAAAAAAAAVRRPKPRIEERERDDTPGPPATLTSSPQPTAIRLTNSTKSAPACVHSSRRRRRPPVHRIPRIDRIAAVPARGIDNLVGDDTDFVPRGVDAVVGVPRTGTNWTSSTVAVSDDDDDDESPTLPTVSVSMAEAYGRRRCGFEGVRPRCPFLRRELRLRRPERRPIQTPAMLIGGILAVAVAENGQVAGSRRERGGGGGGVECDKEEEEGDEEGQWFEGE